MKEFNPQIKETTIKIIGVGGAGGNTVNNIATFIKESNNIELIAANTDIQVLRGNKAPIKITLGEKLTQGRGAGGNPEIGKSAALESIDDIRDVIKGSNLLIITGGMGGGTGTGAMPVIAETARKFEDILIMGIVTKPFLREGDYKIKIAEEGINELKKHVDALIIIPNEKLLTLGDITSKEAYKKADNVLIQTIVGITEIITTQGHVNVDFADIESILKKSGKAFFGIGTGKGEKRHIEAIKNALTSPLIEDADIQNSKGLIVYFKSNENLKVKEQGDVLDYLQKKVSNKNVKLKYGECFDKNMPEDELTIIVIATGFGFEENSLQDTNISKVRERKTLENFNKTSKKNSNDELLKPAFLRRKTMFLD